MDRFGGGDGIIEEKVQSIRRISLSEDTIESI